MTEYISSVIAAAILSGVASLMAPEKWRRYVGIISGLVVLCVIIAPLSEIPLSHIFSSFDEAEVEKIGDEGERIRTEMMKAELSQRINEDVEKRMRDEFGIKVICGAEVEFDDEGRISGVKSITLTGTGITEQAKNRLCEVYGIERISVK